MMSEQTEASRQDHNLVGHVVRRAIPLILLGGVLAGAYYYKEKFWSPNPQPVVQDQQMPPIPVDTFVVQAESKAPAHFRFLGQTEGAQVVEIRSRIAGYLNERSFKEGEKVEEGQQLFQIDPRPFEVEVERAKAELASAEATQIRAEQQLKRFKDLTQKGAVAVEMTEDWETQYQVATAAVHRHKAQLAAAELQLLYTTITSPITGVIGRALKDNGSYIDAGPDGLLAVIQQVDPIYVRFSVTEQELLRFRREQQAGELIVPETQDLDLEVTLSDGSIYPHLGKINFIDIQIDQSTGTNVIRGTVPNADRLLQPGQFIYVSIKGIERPNIIRIPQYAIQQSPLGANVMVVSAENTVEVRAVTLGDWSDKFWVVRSGLNPGDRVITSHLMMLGPGAPVQVASERTVVDEVKNSSAEVATPSPFVFVIADER